MPRFIYTIILINILFALGLIFIFLKIPPNSVTNKIIFLVDLFITLSLFCSVVIFKILTIKKSLFNEPRYIYRNALRRGVLLSLLMGLSLGFNFWGVATKINIILVGLFLLALEIYFSHNNKTN